VPKGIKKQPQNKAQHAKKTIAYSAKGAKPSKKRKNSILF
jgi:hypothetical protein